MDRDGTVSRGARRVRVTVFDYGAGNLHSLAKALPGRVRVEVDPEAAVETDVLVLPGVGSFSQAARCLAPALDLVRRSVLDGLPCVGICLGMQLLFESSEEGPGLGLGVFEGRARRLRARRVPHMGWNDGFYYAHSYVCPPVDVVMTARHEGDEFPAMVRRGNVVGVQFHPEKSGVAGVRFLRRVVAALAERKGVVVAGVAPTVNSDVLRRNGTGLASTIDSARNTPTDDMYSRGPDA